MGNAMAKNRIIATYRIAEHEMVQVSVVADNSYPEALAVCRANTRELMADLFVDIGLAAVDPEAIETVETVTEADS
jgi:hypothetical protein